MRRVSRLLLVLAGLILTAGGAVHAFAFPKAAAAIARARLPAFFGGAFAGLWLSDSANCFALALIFFCIAAWPRLASGRLIVLLALIPWASAASIYATMGGFYAGHALFVVGTASFVAGLLHTRADTTWPA
jgi:hypothetical protein